MKASCSPAARRTVPTSRECGRDPSRAARGRRCARARGPTPGEVDTIGAQNLGFSPRGVPRPDRRGARTDERPGTLGAHRHRSGQHLLPHRLQRLVVLHPALFVPSSGPLTLFLRDMDARGASHTSWPPPEDIVGYPERYVQRPHIHPFDWVAFALRQRWEVARASSSPVGVEMDSHFFSPRAFRALVNGVPEWRLVDSFELVNWIRAIKSADELALMHRAAEVTSAAMDAALGTVGHGVGQHEVAAAISAAQARGSGTSWVTIRRSSRSCPPVRALTLRT